ncbi:MAG: 4-(cytidine 5'-diphospho)-2-C-methyl-D-erythritol kinase [Saccharofermentans sp.]|nr:4-(cytidine 5'-diphospho)-2-C-methyl-D-erythritol kinase [Mageeibacillus sp.]MCI1264440.1 4-(cytidine 5'-diphospho)-2-C-methyl-D-erythritol kinase [Saccharofermentans sp.]MCI1275154.1 4-(cytidine 5'-diphospho)-2-C-methyl-D-erythritol kinase [Saccharofermentans sp.]MCI1768807.1 4-(cytidine 5'-diphospho)-2-C-methyl-D-erythritol kinase [Mageeibacillus sp.]
MNSKDTYETTANAKVNLFLRICGRLQNGYHKLYTVMQELDFCDDITVNIDSGRMSGIEVICRGRSDIDPRKNLCYKAADRFYSQMSKKYTDNRFVSPFTEIEITKRIPSEAGMGGGSSDAAAVLVVLQEHFNNPFTEDELSRIAVNVGADVPFFLYGGTCLCEMVGEVVTPLASLAGMDILVVKPEKGVSTPDCFARIDDKPSGTFDAGIYSGFTDALSVERQTNTDKLEAILRFKDCLINDLQEPAAEFVPQINDIVDLLYDAGASCAVMSGSGSAVFALFEDTKSAETARETVAGDPRSAGCDIILTKTI